MNKLLESVPVDLKDQVGVILTEDAIEANLKLTLFQGIIKDRELLRKLDKYIHQEPDDCPEDWFLDLVSSAGKRGVMKLLLDLGDFENLEKMVEKEGEEVKEAFAGWREEASAEDLRTRKLVTALARPLAQVTEVYLGQKKRVHQTIEELENSRAKRYSSLEDFLTQPEVFMETKPLPQPRTVCMAPSCTYEANINQFETRRIPKDICHDKCSVRGSEYENIDDLSTCRAFKDGKCQKCGCDWKDHVQVTYEWVKEVVEVTDNMAKKRMADYRDYTMDSRVLFRDARGKMTELVRELNYVCEVTAEFKVFLDTNPMEPICYPYLENLIKEHEELFIGGRSDEEFLKEMWAIQADFLDKVDLIHKEIGNGTRGPATPLQLKIMFNKLGELKQCGEGVWIELSKELPPSEEPDHEDTLFENDDKENQPLSEDFSKNVSLGSDGKKPFGSR